MSAGEGCLAAIIECLCEGTSGIMCALVSLSEEGFPYYGEAGWWGGAVVQVEKVNQIDYWDGRSDICLEIVSVGLC